MRKVIMVFIIALSFVFASFITAQMRLYYEYVREERELLAELEKEKEVLNRLVREREQGLTDAYVERIAREVLGLVRHDEIVFINEASR